MDKPDHTPKMFAKFIQLVVFNEELWALDENGDVFYRDAKNRNADDRPVWKQTKTVRENS